MKKLLARAMAVVMLVGFGLVGMAGTAGAQYQPSCSFIFNPPVISPTGTVNITGTGFDPNSTVEFFIQDQVAGSTPVPLGTTTADANGNVNASFPLPSGFTAAGSYTVTVTCPNGVQASNVLVVSAAIGTTTTTGSLPVTGSSGISELVRLAIALIAVGLTVLLLSGLKRRNQRRRSRGDHIPARSKERVPAE